MAQQSAPADTTPLPGKELRFAVTMNGGVSLAVWMGGVTLELDALTRDPAADGPDHTVYGTVMTTLGLSARVDVIAGTSAGGINGAALSLSQVNGSADLSMLRDLWAEQGRFETLLRRPFQGNPTSLLKGDDYFLPALETAFRGLGRNWTERAGDHPIDLTICTTLMTPAQRVVIDSWGQQLPQDVHAGQFHFRHPGELRSAGNAAAGDDDYTSEHCLTLVRRLAAAARASASFPMAFEPTLVNVTPGADDDQRVDMGRTADWWTDDDKNRSRYAVDGGLLANTPTKACLKGIEAMPSQTDVRRVMLLVYPHAPALQDHAAASAKEPPTLTAMGSGLLTALRSEGGRTFVDEIEQHNLRAGSRRSTRRDLVGATADGRGLLAGQLFEQYRLLRVQRGARDVAGHVEPVVGWSFERIRSEAVRAQQAWIDEHGDLPYVPERLTSEEAGWPWGMTAALDVADTVLDVIRHVAGRTDLDVATRESLGHQRSALHQQMARLRHERDIVDRVWTSGQGEPNRRYWQARMEAYQDQLRRGGPGEATFRAVEAVVQILHVVADLPTAPDDALGDWRVLVSPDRDVRGTLRRLLELHVLTYTIGEEPDLRSTTATIDLYQLTAQKPHAFAPQSLTMDDKLGGASIARFSGFLKRSWRVNDWIWGRLDGAADLMTVLLEPERVRCLGSSPGEVVERLVRAVFGAGLAELTAAVDLDDYDIPGVLTEVEALFDDTASRPVALPKLAALLALPRQVQIACEELPALAAAVVGDREDRANDHSRGETFLATNAGLLEELQKTTAPVSPRGTADSQDGSGSVDRLRLGLKALDAFDRAGIGREPLAVEGASDQLIRTATTAGAVAVTMLDSSQAGAEAVEAAHPAAARRRPGAVLDRQRPHVRRRDRERPGPPRVGGRRSAARACGHGRAGHSRVERGRAARRRGPAGGLRVLRAQDGKPAARCRPADARAPADGAGRAATQPGR